MGRRASRLLTGHWSWIVRKRLLSPRLLPFQRSIILKLAIIIFFISHSLLLTNMMVLLANNRLLMDRKRILFDQLLSLLFDLRGELVRIEKMMLIAIVSVLMGFMGVVLLGVLVPVGRVRYWKLVTVTCISGSRRHLALTIIVSVICGCCRSAKCISTTVYCWVGIVTGGQGASTALLALMLTRWLGGATDSSCELFASELGRAVLLTKLQKFSPESIDLLVLLDDGLWLALNLFKSFLLSLGCKFLHALKLICEHGKPSENGLLEFE